MYFPSPMSCGIKNRIILTACIIILTPCIIILTACIIIRKYGVHKHTTQVSNSNYLSPRSVSQGIDQPKVFYSSPLSGRVCGISACFNKKCHRICQTNHLIHRPRVRMRDLGTIGMFLYPILGILSQFPLPSSLSFNSDNNNFSPLFLFMPFFYFYFFYFLF